MSLTFPISLGDFQDLIVPISFAPTLQDNRELSGLGSGQVLAVDLAPQLWLADVQTAELDSYRQRTVEAVLRAIIRSKGTFYMTDMRTSGPAADPAGTTLAGHTVTIADLDTQSLALAGLPAGFRVTAGDYISWDYGDPARRAYHQFVETGTADGTGALAKLEVAPFVRPGSVTGTTVELIRPAAKYIVTPGSFKTGSADANFTQFSFSATQRL